MSIDRYTTEQAQRHLASLRTAHAYSGRASDLMVGRDAEHDELGTQLSLVQAGGSALRFVVGPFGSGKSLLLQSLAEDARDRGFVVMQTSLGPNARLSSSDGDTVRLLTALTQRTSTKARPKGGAFAAVVERYLRRIIEEGGATRLDVALRESLGDLYDLELGFALAHVLTRYVNADRSGDEVTRQCALRWLRGEYSSTVDARRELGTSTVMRDPDVFRYLRAYAAFVVAAGYAGLVIILDELANLFRHLNHPIARGKNQDQILHLFNEAADGQLASTMIVFGATPDTIDDQRRGLASYGALKRRLEGADTGRDGDSVIRLRPLESSSVVELADRVRALWSRASGTPAPMSSEDLVALLTAETARPDNAIRTFVQALDAREVDLAIETDGLGDFALDATNP